jgi:hypothetical protein
MPAARMRRGLSSKFRMVLKTRMVFAPMVRM